MTFPGIDAYQRHMDQRRQDGLARSLRWLDRGDAGQVISDGRSLLNLSSNDYLGLARHPLLIQRATAWGERWGSGAGASRLVCGSLEPFRRLEARLAALHGCETALIFNSGFQANTGVLAALLDRRVLTEPPLVFADRLVHASIHQGCQLAGVRQIRFRHNDMNHLEELLQAHADHIGPRFIITESLFSMEGDLAPLASLLTLKERYQAFLYLDEAHAVGVLGQDGRGLAADHAGRVDLVLSTFGKALGASGAYVACSAVVRDYLLHQCTAFIYSTALSPLVLGAVDAALDLLPAWTSQRTTLLDNAAWFRQGLQQAGWSTGSSCSQIIPAMTGSPERALAVSHALEQAGILGVAIRPPTVPTQASRIRFSLTTDHSREMLGLALSAMALIASREEP